MKEQIEEFIKRRFPVDCNWMNGNCYHFAVILNNVFDLPIIYLPVEGHFAVLDYETNAYYDWLGYHRLKDTVYYSWENLKIADPLLYKKLIIDCIK